MTDYLKNKNERNAALMAQTFSGWERRFLRGWQIWDYAVSLEPVFIPIKSPAPPIIAPAQDDARLQHGFGRLLGRNQTTNPPKLVSPSEQTETKIKPTAFYRSEPLVELNIILPKEFDVSPAVCEQFFLSLSSFQTPVSFEILADSNAITIQFAFDKTQSSHLKNQLKTFFPDFVINENQTVLKSFLTNQEQTVIADFGLARQFLLPLQTFHNFNPDPLTGLISSLANLGQGERAVVQILFQKAKHNWAEEVTRVFHHPDIKSAFSNQISHLREKFSSPLFAVLLRLAVASPDKTQSWNILRRIGGGFTQFSTPNGNELIALSNDGLSTNNHFLSFINRTSYRNGMLLNTAELAALAHLPSSSIKVEKLRRDAANTKAAPASALGHSFILGQNEHQGAIKTISLSEETRTRHLLTLGATGSGKTNALLYYALQDIQEGRGCAVFDVHGDLIDEIVENIPPERIKDVILFDPGDADYPIGFNPLVAHSETEKTLLTSDLIGIFRRFSTSWGDVMDSVLANAILAFVESSRGGSLFDLKRFLIEKNFRNEFLTTVTDEAVKYFWQNEFPLIKGKPQASILLRLDTFLRQKLVRNIVCQKAKTLNFRNILDSGKIFLAKLSLGIIGEQNSYLLGTFLLAKLQQTALSRQDSPNRPFFAIYADEFHHLICPTISTLLSGVRKFRVGLALFLQQFRQIQEKDSELAASVLANCGTRVCFRLGDEDANRFQNGFSFFTAEHLQNLAIGEAIARIERADYDFNLKIPLVPKVNKDIAEQRRVAVLESSRAQFATPKAEVESELLKGKTIQQESVMAKAEPPSQAAQEAVEETLQVEKTEVIKEINNQGSPTDSSHRYLQNIIKRIGETKGFVAVLEKQVFGGVGKIDVALENEHLKIACEIAVTNTVEYELQNIQKCLASGFDKVAVISTDVRHLANIRKRAEGIISELQLARVFFLEPDNFHLFLDSLNQQVDMENKIKGYRVNVGFKETPAKESDSRKQTVFEILSGVIKRKDKK